MTSRNLIEIKEKTFEHYFQGELRLRTNRTFAPDQCDEFHVGFDGAYFLHLDHIIEIITYRRPNRQRRLNYGVYLDESFIEHLPSYIRKRLPDWKCNFLIQYKRPEYIRGHNSNQWNFWRMPYYRYAITPHQHERLANIEANSHGRCAAVYASPAFRKTRQLFRFAQANNVIANSNICEIKHVSGHRVFTYVSPGNIGRPNPSSDAVTSTTLDELISNGMQQESMNFDKYIAKLSEIIRKTISELGEKEILDEAISTMVHISEIEDTFTQDLVTLTAFCRMNDTSILAWG